MKVFEYFGSRELAPERVRDLVAQAAGLEFVLHDSYYIGEYYETDQPGGDAVVTIRANELTDEDGTFLQWEEFADYTTVIEASQRLAKATDPADFLDQLHDSLSSVAEVDFLRRSQPLPHTS